MPKIFEDGSQAVQLTGSNIQQPVDIQSRYQTTIQTHNQVSVGASSASIPATWNDGQGFNELGVTLLNDASTSNYLIVYWSHNGVDIHGAEIPLTQNTEQRRVGNTTMKARYYKLAPFNADTVTHVMSAWAYLKA